jgi:hypothetical protein
MAAAVYVQNNDPLLAGAMLKGLAGSETDPTIGTSSIQPELEAVVCPLAVAGKDKERDCPAVIEPLY